MVYSVYLHQPTLYKGWIWYRSHQLWDLQGFFTCRETWNKSVTKKSIWTRGRGLKYTWKGAELVTHRWETIGWWGQVNEEGFALGETNSKTKRGRPQTDWDQAQTHNKDTDFCTQIIWRVITRHCGPDQDGCELTRLSPLPPIKTSAFS